MSTAVWGISGNIYTSPPSLLPRVVRAHAHTDQINYSKLYHTVGAHNSQTLTAMFWQVATRSMWGAGAGSLSVLTLVACRQECRWKRIDSLWDRPGGLRMSTGKNSHVEHLKQNEDTLSRSRLASASLVPRPHPHLGRGRLIFGYGYGVRVRVYPPAARRRIALTREFCMQ